MSKTKVQKGSFMSAIMGQQDQGAVHPAQAAHDAQHAQPAQDVQYDKLHVGVSRLNVAFDAQLMADMKTLASIREVSVTKLINDEMERAVAANMDKITAQRRLRGE